MTNNVTFSLTPFDNVQFSGDIPALAQLLADHLQGTLDNTVFTGQNGGTEPPTNVGLWFNSTYFEYFNTLLGKYFPLDVVVGRSVAGVVKTAKFVGGGGQTTDIILTLPIVSGTLAVVGQAPGGTETIQNNSIAINWSSPSLYAVLSGAATITDAGGGTDNKSIELWIETPPNTGSPLAVTLPAQWRKGASLALSTTDSTHRAVDHFRLTNIGGEVFTEKIGSFQIETSGSGTPTSGGSDTTPPDFARAYTQAGNIVVEFSELVVGTTTSTSWIAKKGGIVQGITSIKVSGNSATLIMTTSVTTSDVLTIEMLSSSGVTDLAGNAAVAFGPVSVDMLS